MADLLMLVGTLGLIAGVWGLVRPIHRLGINDRGRAAAVTGAALVLGVAGGALAGPAEETVSVPVPLIGTTTAMTIAAAQASTTAAPTPSTLPPTTSAVPTGTVVRLVEVLDGDTIVVAMPDATEEEVRLIGVDAPERTHDGAASATAVLEDLIDGADIVITQDVSDRDRFGRLLRYLWVGDRLVNEELVRAGVAVARRYPPDTAHAATLEAAQRQARVQALGIWTATTTSSTSTTTSTTIAVVVAAPTTTSAPECHPSYVGECVPVGVEDVDCRGGSGNGPFYVGRVTVVGWDEYGLDRDNDGIGCESG